MTPLKSAIKKTLAAAVILLTPAPVLAAGKGSGDSAPLPLLNLFAGTAKAASGAAGQDQGQDAAPAEAAESDSPNRGFLYFREDAGTNSGRIEPEQLPSLSSDITTFTPRGVTMPQGRPADSIFPDETGVLNSFTPRQAAVNIGINLGSDAGEQEKRQSFQISLSSTVAVQPVNLSGLFNQNLLGQNFNRQSMNLGLNVGYLGFNLGAFLVRESGGLTPGYEGLDVGLSYQGSSWSTTLSIGEYNRRLNGLITSPLGLDENFYALQFGAAYYLSPALRFSGGVRFFEYGPNFGLTPDLASRSQLFYLGTNLNF